MKKTELITTIADRSSLAKSEVKLVLENLETILKESLRSEGEPKVKLSIGHFTRSVNGRPKFSPSPKFIREVMHPELTEATEPISQSKQQQSVTPKKKGIRKNALRNHQ